MSRPQRVRLSRKKGWRMPTGTVKVDRSTIFGNPFVIGEPNHLGWGEVKDAAHAVWLFRTWLIAPARSIAFEVERHERVLRALPTLTGKDLACWCTLGGACHADVLLELADGPHVADMVEALLDLDVAIPRTPIENTVATAQVLRATGSEPADATRLLNAIAALRAEARS